MSDFGHGKTRQTLDVTRSFFTQGYAIRHHLTDLTLLLLYQIVNRLGFDCFYFLSLLIWYLLVLPFFSCTRTSHHGS